MLEFKFIPTKTGKKLLMLKRYTYSQIHPFHYYCSKKASGCKAQIKLNKHGRIVRIEGSHLHEPPTYITTRTDKLEYKFIPTKTGKKLLMVNRYTYSETFPFYFYCSKRLTGCNARVKTNNRGNIVRMIGSHLHDPPTYIITQTEKLEYKFIPTKTGKKLLMVNSYTYSQVNPFQYYCSKRVTGCKARIKLNKQGKIDKMEGSHFHQPPTYIMTRSEKLEYKFIPTKTGKKMLMVNSYTYSQMDPFHYYCSKRVTGCKARIKLNKEGNILKMEASHLHEPPTYIKTRSGEYIKIKS